MTWRQTRPQKILDVFILFYGTSHDDDDSTHGVFPGAVLNTGINVVRFVLSFEYGIVRFAIRFGFKTTFKEET